MSKNAKTPTHYPMEAPNTSVFSPPFLTFFTAFGWARQDTWWDIRGNRRYETSYELTRRFFILYLCLWVLPPGVLGSITMAVYGGEYHFMPYLYMFTRMPVDNMFIEDGMDPLNREWVRHIHSQDSY